MMFWRKNNAGYTYNLDDCRLFTKEEAYKQNKIRDTDIPYSKSFIDSLAERHVDIQDLRREMNLNREPKEGIKNICTCGHRYRDHDMGRDGDCLGCECTSFTSTRYNKVTSDLEKQLPVKNEKLQKSIRDEIDQEILKEITRMAIITNSEIIAQMIKDPIFEYLNYASMDELLIIVRKCYKPKTGWYDILLSRPILYLGFYTISGGKFYINITDPKVIAVTKILDSYNL